MNKGRPIHITRQPRYIGGLTKRQLEVVGCVLRGLAHKETAERLRIAERTVKYYMQTIYADLNIQSTRMALVHWALENELVRNVDLEAMGRVFLGQKS